LTVRALREPTKRYEVIAMPQHVAFADNSQLARNKTPKPRITPRVKSTIDAVVHHRKPWDEAAIEAGLTTRAMRLAFEKPHVLAYYKQQMKVLRDARTVQNHYRLCDIADADNNMPAVNALKALEMLSDNEQINRPNTPSPGISIRIVQVSNPPPPIDIKAAPRVIDAGE
jgi:hypothetical protein